MDDDSSVEIQTSVSGSWSVGGAVTGRGRRARVLTDTAVGDFARGGGVGGFDLHSESSLASQEFAGIIGRSEAMHILRGHPTATTTPTHAEGMQDAISDKEADFTGYPDTEPSEGNSSSNSLNTRRMSSTTAKPPLAYPNIPQYTSKQVKRLIILPTAAEIRDELDRLDQEEENIRRRREKVFADMENTRAALANPPVENSHDLDTEMLAEPSTSRLPDAETAYRTPIRRSDNPKMSGQARERSKSVGFTLSARAQQGEDSHNFSAVTPTPATITTQRTGSSVATRVISQDVITPAHIGLTEVPHMVEDSYGGE